MIDRTQQPAVKTIDQISVALPQRSIMPNGVPLNIIHAGEQEVVRLDLLFVGGKWHQTQLLQTLFTNRMLREGTRQYTSAHIAERLDYYGAWLELSTSMEYSYVTLYSLTKYFDRTLAVLESILKEPLFPEKELFTVLDANKQQFRVNSTKVDFLAQRSFLRSLFGVKHPCGQTAELADYDLLTPEVLKEFYHRYYHSGNCSIYISGKVSAEVIRSVESAFGAQPFGDTSHRAILTPCVREPSDMQRVFTEREDAMQSSLKMGTVMMERSHPDYLKLRVLTTLYGGYFGSRLMSNIREEKGYTYGISAGMVFYPGTGVFMVHTEAANEFIEKIVREVYREIQLLQTKPVGKEELTMVKNYMIGEMSRTFEGPFSLSDTWIFTQTSHLDDSFFQHSLEAIQQVTADEIQTLAQKYLPTEGMMEVVVGKEMGMKTTF